MGWAHAIELLAIVQGGRSAFVTYSMNQRRHLVHHGGDVGIGRSIHAGQVGVADGTELAAAKLEALLTNDPGMGVIRHVDAGYSRAAEVAKERGVRVPMEATIRD